MYYNGSWTERGYALPATTVRKVAVMKNSNEIAYALMNGTSSLPKVLRTTNHGVSWTDVTGNLPNEIPVSDLVMHPSDPLNTLYLGDVVRPASARRTGEGCGVAGTTACPTPPS